MSFDHLDDPVGFVPDDEFRAAARRDGRRRRARRRTVLAGGSVLTSVAVLVAVVAGLGLWRTSQIDRVDVDFATPPVDLDHPFNVLLIGSDSREGLDTEQVAGARSDTMIVVRVEPAERRVTLLSLPRDLVVTPLAGGEPERLNAAFARGGASELVRTVETRLGIPLSAYVQIDFRGLVHLVDEVGGVPVMVTQGLRDRQTGLDIGPSPCADLDGATALALVRSRHLEVLQPDGRYLVDRTSDIGRQRRQQAVIESLLPRLGQLVDGLGGLEAAVTVASSDVTIDDRLDLPTLIALGRWAVQGPVPTAVRPQLPLAGTTLADGSEVLLLGDDAAAVIAEVGGSLPTETRQLAASLAAADGATDLIVTEIGVAPIGPCT
jgi:LCP family protein required for cell wall assembly